MEMNMDKVQAMCNTDLLELYAQKVRCDHYDPYETPPTMKALYEANVTQKDLLAEILLRMV